MTRKERVELVLNYEKDVATKKTKRKYNNE